MKEIKIINNHIFTLAGVPYGRIYQPIKMGENHFGIYNVYDSRQQILGATRYDEVKIDGTTYNSLNELVIDLVGGLYNPAIAMEEYATIREMEYKIQESYNDIVNSIGTGFQGTIKIADTPTETGIYIPTEAGVYPNAGGLEYAPEGDDEGFLVQFINNGSEWVKSSYQLGDNVTNEVIKDNPKAVSSGGVYEAMSPLVSATLGDNYPLQILNLYVAGNIGDVATVSTGSNTLISSADLQTAAGDIFSLTGKGGTEAALLYTILDAENRILARSGEHAEANGLEVKIEQAGRIIFNTLRDVPEYGIRKAYDLRSSLSAINSRVSELLKETAIDPLPLGSTNINVSGEEGRIATVTSGTSTAIIGTSISVVKGDLFILSGRGTNASPLYTILDSDDRILVKTPAGTEVDKVIEIHQAGRIIFNTYLEEPNYGIFKPFTSGEAIKDLREAVENIAPGGVLKNGQNFDYISPGAPDDIQEGEFYIDSRYYDRVYEWKNGVAIRRLSKKGHTYFFKGVPYYYDKDSGRYIPSLSGGEKLIGSRIVYEISEEENVTPVLANTGSIRGYSVEVNIGDIISVSGFTSSSVYGSLTTLIYADDTGKVIHSADGRFNRVTYAFTCWTSGKVYVNLEYPSNEGIVVIRKGTETKKISSRVNFEKDLTVRDFESDLAQFEFKTPQFMSQVYAAYDTLMAQNPDYITRTDLAELTEIPYPEYANGISLGHPDYLETPAYKTYMYKLAEPDNIRYNDKHKKRKIFIMNALHGDEQAAIVTSYLIAKQLCDNTASDSNMFELRRNFDIYIVPCTNGYGVIHNTRNNANDINLNRNWPAYGLENEPQGSEFEVQLLMSTLNLVEPDVPIDFHNFFSGAYQSYDSVYSDFASRPIFNSYTKSSQAILNKYPEFFGTKYQIFSALQSYPKDIASPNGIFAVWAYTKFNNNYGMTYEVSANIQFLNGEFQPSTKPTPENGKEVMAVNEHFFRELLFSVGKQVADHPETVWNNIS